MNTVINFQVALQELIFWPVNYHVSKKYSIPCSFVLPRVRWHWVSWNCSLNWCHCKFVSESHHDLTKRRQCRASSDESAAQFRLRHFSDVDNSWTRAQSCRGTQTTVKEYPGYRHLCVNHKETELKKTPANLCLHPTRYTKVREVAYTKRRWENTVIRSWLCIQTTLFSANKFEGIELL